MTNYFFTADTHFSHYNIMRYCDRPFETVQEMNQTLIENWNNAVAPNDVVYHLGDFGFWKRGDLNIIFRQLNGRKYLIKGNHDTSLTFKLDWMWVKDVAGIKVNGYYIWLSHFPHVSWDKSFHGSWHLFGHVHGLTPGYGRSFDVGVDANNYSPVSVDHVKTRIESIIWTPTK